MNGKIYTLILCLIIVPQRMSAAVNIIDPEWRYPNKSDIKWDWKDYFEINPEPFHIVGDFNGDGLQDNAWIMIGVKDSNAWRLSVHLTQESGDDKIFILDESFQGIPAQAYGLTKLSPGHYLSVCNKGHGDTSRCMEDEIDIPYDGINFFRYESAGRIFYYKNDKFNFIWESD